MKRSTSTPKKKGKSSQVRSRTRGAKRATRRRPPFTIFISHIHEEALVAEVLRDWFHAAFPGLVAAFVSSDYEDNPLGSRWLDTIDRAMNQARLVLTLMSPQSSQRMWIHLEAGWARGRNIDILPLCHGGMTMAQLPRPYSDYSGTAVDRVDFARRLLMALKQHLGLEHRLPPGMLTGLTDDVKNACAQLRASTSTATATKQRTTAPARAAELPNARVAEVASVRFDGDLLDALVAVPWRLFFNPKVPGLHKSKIMRFGANGEITQGANQNEASWRIQQDRLELLDSASQVHSRFTYDRSKRRFSHTNDPDTGSITKHGIRDQYLVVEA